MSQEERNLRFENAIATLTELAATLTELSSKQDERISVQEERSSAQDERISTVERGLLILAELQRNAVERADQHLSWINQLGARTESLNVRMEELAVAQAESEQRIAALADAQIRTEDALRDLKEAQASAVRDLKDALRDIVQGKRKEPSSETE